jgi:hypothetical protein
MNRENMAAKDGQGNRSLAIANLRHILVYLQIAPECRWQVLMVIFHHDDGRITDETPQSHICKDSNLES